jgi:branched-chain amino acid transport system ATP-binding protein
MLVVDKLSTYYGSIQALKNITLHVQQGEVVTILGTNGAGKSTLMKTISGLIKPRTGTIHFLDRDITNLSPKALVEQGIVQVPEGRMLFGPMNVSENLKVGTYCRKNDPKSAIAEDMEWVLELFPRLKERLNQQASTLSGGEQQMLAIGRALMMKPKLLLLDEPSTGLAPIIVERIFEIIKELNQKHKLTILIVEQNVEISLSIAHRAYLVEVGSVKLESKADDLLQGDLIQKSYLGGI